MRLRDSTIDTTAASGIDPVADGAWLQIYNAAGGADSACMTLGTGSGAGWMAKGDVLRPSFRYRDHDYLLGPCRSVRVSARGELKADCSSIVQPLDYSLDEPSQGAVAVRFGSGAAEYCAVFGGEVREDSQADRFAAKGSVAPAQCPAPPVGCGP